MLKVKDELKLLIEADVAGIFWGRQGIGKTTVINEIAQEMFASPDRDDIEDPVCLTLVLSQMDPMDLMGLPSRTEEGYTDFAKPTWWPKKEGGIILLDELNRATRECVNAAHQLVLEKRIFNNRLPKGWFVVAACNPDTDDEYGLIRFGAAFMDRFCHLKVQGNFPAWKSWAEKAGKSEEIISFLSAQKNLLSPTENKFNFDTTLEKVDPSPRAWDAVDRILVACNENHSDKFLKTIGRTCIKGLVGAVATNAIFRHLDEYVKKPMNLADVLKLGTKDPRWVKALDGKEVPYMVEVLNSVGKQLEKVFAKIQKDGGEKKLEAAVVSKKYKKWWELCQSTPDEVIVGWWNSLQSSTVWDEVAVMLPGEYGERVAQLYHQFNN